jgi:hypothetical protein
MSADRNTTGQAEPHPESGSAPAPMPLPDILLYIIGIIALAVVAADVFFWRTH